MYILKENQIYVIPENNLYLIIAVQKTLFNFVILKHNVRLAKELSFKTHPYKRRTAASNTVSGTINQENSNEALDNLTQEDVDTWLPNLAPLQNTKINRNNKSGPFYLLWHCFALILDKYITHN